MQQQTRPELIQTADLLAREKGITKEDVLQAMEVAIAKAGRTKYGAEYDIRAKIDPKTGAIRLARYTQVVDEIEDEVNQVLKSDLKDKNLNVGDYIIDELPPIDFGRIAAGTAKQIITQKIREAERNVQYKEFIDKKGQIVHGTVKRIELGNVIVDLGRAEAVLRRDEMIPEEVFRVGDRLRAYVLDVRSEVRGPQIFLSRSHPNFMAELFRAEVPEVYDGLIEIKAVARDPGSRAKVAVYSSDSSIEARGACIGMRGVRVQTIVSELQGEKIDVVYWSNDPATFIINALASADVSKIVLDEETHRAEVVVPDDQLSQAIGRRGQNIRLTSQLTGWHIDVMNADQEAEHRQAEEKDTLELFIKALDVDEMIAHLLITEGFTKIDELALTSIDELSSIEGFDEELATELQSRALTFLAEEKKAFDEKVKEQGIGDKLKELEGLTVDMIEKLGQNNIKTIDDFADLSGDELLEILGQDLISKENADKLIMKAREHWFDGENA